MLSVTLVLSVQVMSEGQVLEIGTPLALLENRRSHFFAMVSKTGDEASRKLYQLAVDADWQRNKPRREVGGDECDSADRIHEVGDSGSGGRNKSRHEMDNAVSHTSS